MIDPHWSVVDLDPRTWRNIGRFFDPGQYIRAAQPGEHALYVLHDSGRLLRIVDTEQGVLNNLAISSVADPEKLAQQLYEQDRWQRVHIINKRHLAGVARQAQQFNGSLHLDAYYRQIYHLLWGQEHAYVCLPPHPGHWHGWTYQNIQDFTNQLPPAASMAIGVFADDTLEIGLILEWHQGQISRITTFEALPEPTLVTEVSPEALAHLWRQLEAQFASPAAVLLCTWETFNHWVETVTDKHGILQEARDCGQAFWRLEL
ncbi:MAG TPA: hypothetical protein VKR06_33075 [Ktedonosporobacter sp.]|nr:hypothetical protein [Ktedonosporobacter sp.]